VGKMQKGEMQSIVYDEYDEQYQWVGVLIIILMIIEVLISEAKSPYFKNLKLFKKK
jgi:Ca-activated chloride channel family protein